MGAKEVKGGFMTERVFLFSLVIPKRNLLFPICNRILYVGGKVGERGIELCILEQLRDTAKDQEISGLQ
jgi:hypothetical protein